MTFGQLHRILLTELQKIYTANEAGILSNWVFEKRLNFSKGDIIKNSKGLIEEKFKIKIENDLRRLLQHEPVQYVLEEAWFYKMKLTVNNYVLIPRPETEELVEWVVKTTPDHRPPTTHDHQKPTIDHHRPLTTLIDIGTGSGCIAIAIKKQSPFLDVTAIDISENALSIAKENATAKNVSIDFKKIDFLNNNEWGNLQQYNIIVSNPPYIPFNEKEKLDKNVAGYEPETALFVPENDPLLFYKKIVEFAKHHLKAKGEIWVEVHENFAKEVFDLFFATYNNAEIKKDIYGKNRIVTTTHCL